MTPSDERPAVVKEADDTMTMAGSQGASAGGSKSSPREPLAVLLMASSRRPHAMKES
jgi:hypothetical protein